ncbi:hypothetical protein GGR54DRAFT_414698 [Hypoxylon sp. NC1633]|nr:hypothetical protein GGR54DRAFT_414698 [Hypoxylon sp. NC1633]
MPRLIGRPMSCIHTPKIAYSSPIIIYATDQGFWQSVFRQSLIEHQGTSYVNKLVRFLLLVLWLGFIEVSDIRPLGLQFCAYQNFHLDIVSGPGKQAAAFTCLWPGLVIFLFFRLPLPSFRSKFSKARGVEIKAAACRGQASPTRAYRSDPSEPTDKHQHRNSGVRFDANSLRVLRIEII